MPISIGNQAYIFLYSVLSGMLIAFIYDVFRIKRKAIKTGNIGIYFEDLIYWVIVATIMFGMVYLSNDGEIRGYIFIGVVIGISLYVLVFSKIIIKTALIIIRLIYKISKFVWKILSFPIIVLLKIISIPLRLLYKIFNNIFKIVKRLGRGGVRRVKLNSKILKKIRKKI